MSYLTYDKYKDSGVEWLGEIPEHWEVISLKHISNITLGKMLTPNNKGEMVEKAYLRSKNIQWTTVDINDVKTMWFTNKELKNLRLQKDDILVSEGGEVGRACMWNEELEECYIQNSVHRVRMKTENSKFYLYQFWALGKSGFLETIVNRISIAHLTKEKLANLKFISVPPLDEKAITEFLDQETAKTNTLIKEKENLLKLLDENQSAFIAKVVTQGLDDSVEMKESGVDVFGRIPKHWEVRRLKTVIKSISQGWSPQVSNNPAENDEWGVLKLSAINKGNFLPQYNKALPENLDHPEHLLLKKNDFLMSRANTSKLVGDVCVVSEDYNNLIYSDLNYCIHFDLELINIHFIKNYLLSFAGRRQIEMFARGSSSSMVKLSQEHVKNIWLCVPPLEEQNSIIQLSHSKLKALHELESELKSSITILKSHRSALITSVVTGKIKVSEEVC